MTHTALVSAGTDSPASLHVTYLRLIEGVSIDTDSVDRPGSLRLGQSCLEGLEWLALLVGGQVCLSRISLKHARHTFILVGEEEVVSECVGLVCRHPLCQRSEQLTKPVPLCGRAKGHLYGEHPAHVSLARCLRAFAVWEKEKPNTSSFPRAHTGMYYYYIHAF